MPNLRPPEGTDCWYCGLEEATVYDHVVPRSKGGNDALTNLVPACKPCNSSKGALSLEQFRLKTYFVDAGIGWTNERQAKAIIALIKNPIEPAGNRILAPWEHDLVEPIEAIRVAIVEMKQKIRLELKCANRLFAGEMPDDQYEACFGKKRS